MSETEDPPAAVTALDTTAVVLSLLCLLHCLALPLLLLVLPLASVAFVADERFHLWMLALVLPTTLLALGGGYRRHRRAVLLWLGTLGVVAIALAAIGRLWWGFSETSDTAITVVGALTLALVHVQNLRLQRRLHWHRPGESHEHI